MILVAGLTPAWQQILCFDRLRVGEVNRAAAVAWCASGKVLNAGMAVHALGVRSLTLAPVGGASGAAIRAEFQSRGIPAEFLAAGTATRICTTLMDRSTQQITELVENAGPLDAACVAAFRERFREAAALAKVIVITGSLPAGTPATFWAELLDGVAAPAILDIRGDELLATLPLRPHVVKPNREELARTVGRELTSEAEIVSAAAELCQRGAQHVIITQGGGVVVIHSARGSYRTHPPTIAAVNPIGSGDCFTAGIACALAEGTPLPEAARLGVAAAVENARTLLPARLDRDAVRALAATLVVESLATPAR